MSTETTNKKIKIDNGTTFGRTYTDKAVDELLKNVGGEEVLNVSVSMTAQQLSLSINSSGISTPYTEENKAVVFDFIKAQKGVIRLTVNTPIGNLYMTLRPTLWKDDTVHSYNFEGSLYLETDLSAIGGSSSFNQIIVRAICWDTDNSVSFRPTIIPIETN